MLAYAIVSIVCGHFVIQRIVRIRMCEERMTLMLITILIVSRSSPAPGDLAWYYALTAQSRRTQRLRDAWRRVRRDRARPRRGAGPDRSRMLLALGPVRLRRRRRAPSADTRSAIAGLRCAATRRSLFIGARTLVSVGPALFVLVPGSAAGEPLARRSCSRRPLVHVARRCNLLAAGGACGARHAPHQSIAGCRTRST